MFWLIKNVSSSQDFYDIAVFGLSKMPKKSIAVATAIIFSGNLLYFTSPDSLIIRGCEVVVCSGAAWAVTEATHQLANKLWDRRFAEIKAIDSSKNFVLSEEQQKLNQEYVVNYLSIS